jgi:hypothetical protein
MSLRLITKKNFEARIAVEVVGLMGMQEGYDWRAVVGCTGRDSRVCM